MNKILHFQKNSYKIRFLVVLVAIASIGFSVENAYAAKSIKSNLLLTQQINDKRVTLSISDKNIDEILSEIAKQTKINYGYHNSIKVDLNQKYSIVAKNETVSSVLNRLFEKTIYDFVVENDKIVVLRKTDKSKVDKTRFLLKGRVLNAETKQPLVGATIVNQEYITSGVLSDDKGAFELNVINGDRFEVAYIGMKHKIITANVNDSNIIIYLEDEAIEIKDVVVTGYQAIDESKSTGATQKLKMDDIITPGLTSIDKILEGRVPGMTFVQNSGQVGATPKIRIRGTSTIVGNQNPLWVVDGIVQNDPVNVDPARLNDLDFVNLLGNAISGLNPEDVDQIDVLKDASATAIYGVRAANGVIVITTKQGKVGKPTLSYSMNGTFTPRPRYSDKTVNMMNSKERVAVSREQFERGANFGNVTEWFGYEKAYLDYRNRLISADQFKSEASYYETLNTDWFDVVARNSFSNKHTLSISGGSPSIKYYASIGYNDEQGVIRKEKNEAMSSYLKLNGSYDRFKFQISTKLATSNKHYTPEGFNKKNIIQYAYEMNRAVPAYHPDGERYFYNYGGLTNSGFAVPFNIEHEMDHTGIDIKSYDVTVTGNFIFDIYKDIKFEATTSYSAGNTNQDSYFTEQSAYIKEFHTRGETLNLAPLGGEWRNTGTRLESYTARGQLNYNTFVDKNEKHFVNALIGAEVSSTEYNNLSQSERGYYADRGRTFAKITQDFIDKNPGYAEWSMNNYPTIGETLTNLGSLFFSGIYSYDDRYTVSFSSRIDGSNQFGSRSNEKLLPIWSVGGRWNIKRDFFRESETVNDLSLKLSYGKQGNMLDNQTSRMIIQKGGYNNAYESFSSSIANFPNPDLRWEVTNSFSTEITFSLLKNKITGSVGYFYKKTQDAFLNKKISEINGIENYVVNSGNIVNQGVELLFRFTPFEAKIDAQGRRGFSWSFDPQIGQVVNKLIERAINNKTNVVRDKVTYEDYLSGNVELAGKPINTFYSYRFKGLDPSDGSPMFYNMENDREAELKARYKHMRNDEIFMEVMVESGTRMPIIQGGFSNYFGYRQFGLSFNFSYSLGNKIRLLKLTDNNNVRPYPLYNVRKEFVDRWQKPGDEQHTDIPGIITSPSIGAGWWYSLSGSDGRSFAPWSPYEVYDMSDLRVASGDYFKLQSLTFRYNVPEAFCKKIKLKSAYLSLAGTNLFTIASKDLKGQDVSQSGSANTINLSVRPTYSVSLNVAF